MKNWIRTILVSLILVGGTAFFAYQYINQFNSALDNLSASSFAIASTRPIPLSDKTNKEQVPTPTQEETPTPTPETTPTTIQEDIPTPTPEDIPTPATLSDLKLSFLFSKENNKIYIGCTYQLFLFQSSTTISSLETSLIDAGNDEIAGSILSDQVRENKIEPNFRSLDWKIESVWPGKYYIKVSDIDDVDLESKVFSVGKMPNDISADEKEKICNESGGSF